MCFPRYIPIDGLATFKTAAAALILGKVRRVTFRTHHASSSNFNIPMPRANLALILTQDSPALAEGRVASSQALSGTGTPPLILSPISCIKL